MEISVEENIKPDYDIVLNDIAEYILNYKITSELAYETARLCLMDTLGCGILALNFPACTKLLGPVVPGAIMRNGSRVPGTDYELDPVQAAFNIGTMIRWLDFNDTWLAAEWGHPSDNLGAILAVADYLSRQGKPITMHDVLTYMIKAHEIQGCLALENSFNAQGLDHVILVKVASSAVVCAMLGGNKDHILRVLSQVFVDGQSLRTYRHAPNAGSRKSWAAGDAAARAVRLALITMNGEMGYPSALSAKRWGFYDVLFAGHKFKFQRPYTEYVMENVLFKISYPAEFHAQTAVECAVKLHPIVINRLDEISKIELITHESAIRIISKNGSLHNPADRDHCLQYMVAIGLLLGTLEAKHYEDAFAKDPRIDMLRNKMQVTENKQFSLDYHDPLKRSIANSIKITFKDGQETDMITIEYPVGHKNRRKEGVPLLLNKFKNNLLTRFSEDKYNLITRKIDSLESIFEISVSDFMQDWCI